MRTIFLVLLTMVSFPSQATLIQLSEFMGVPSGSTTTASNAPYTAVIIPAEFGGFGVDIAGEFSPSPIQFSDTGPFERGIGAHPNSHIDFNLDAFRALGSFDTFMTTVGIDIAGGGDFEGLTFDVLGDGTLLASVIVQNISAGSTAFSVNVAGVTTLSLITQYAPFEPQTNWGAWADAKLNLQTVPEPTTLSLLSVGLIGFGLMRRRRLAA